MRLLVLVLLSLVLAPFTAMAQQHASPRPRTAQEAQRLLPQPPPARPRPPTPHQQACRVSRESTDATAQVEWEEWRDHRDVLHVRLMAARGGYRMGARGAYGPMPLPRNVSCDAQNPSPPTVVQIHIPPTQEDAIGYGGLGSPSYAFAAWHPGSSGETVWSSDYGSLPTAPEPAPLACNAQILRLRATYRASAFCTTPEGRRPPDTAIIGHVTLVSATRVHRAPTPR